MRIAAAAHLITGVFLLASSLASAASIDVDVQGKYGKISLASINRALVEARHHFDISPDDIVTLRLPPGVFSLAPVDRDSDGLDVSGIHPSVSGRLILRGAGKAATTLVFDSHRQEILGRDATHISFIGLHFTGGHMTVSQGHVIQVLPGAVVLRIEDGFPTPADLFNPAFDRGRYLRRCDDNSAHPRFSDDPGNRQVAWWQAALLTGRDWRIELMPGRSTPDFHIGDLLAIKSKGNDGGAYRFTGGADIVFDDVTWSRVTRGVFRGTNQVKILNASIIRDPAVAGHVPCLASAGGGPQIGQPHDPATTGDVIENFTATGTGDDSIALFNATGMISHVTIADSFARGILLYNSPGVVLEDIHVDRAPILRN